MKFGKYLFDSLIQEWKTHYIDYWRLKKYIKNLDGPEAERTNFDREIENVESFYSSCLLTLKHLVEKADLATAENTRSENNILDEHVKKRSIMKAVKIIDNCEIYARKLSRYCFLNLEGFRKILKKFEKHGGDSRNYYSKVLSTQFANYRNTLIKFEEYVKSFIQRLDEKSGERDARKELDRIWDKATSILCDRKFFESDFPDDFVDQAKGLGFNEQYFNLSQSSSEMSIIIIEREIFLMCVLRGICSWSATDCLKSLLSVLQVNLKQLEHIADFSIISEFISLRKGTESWTEKDKIFLDYILINGGFYEGILSDLLHLAAGLHTELFGPIFLKAMDLFPEYINQIDEYFVTPLYYAIASDKANNCQLIIHHCIKSKINVKIYAGEKDSNPVILCVDFNSPKSLAAIAEILPQCINDIDDSGQSALHHSAKRNYIECTRILLDKGAVIDLPEESSKWTPLFFAAMNGSIDLCETLIKYNARLDLRDNEGWQACEHAAFRGHHILATMIRPGDFIVEEPNLNTGSQGSQTSISFGHAFLAEGFRIYFRVRYQDSAFFQERILYNDKQNIIRISGSHSSIVEKHLDLGPYTDNTEVFFEIKQMLTEISGFDYFLFTLEEESESFNGAISFATLFCDKKNNASFSLDLPLISANGKVTCILRICILVAASFRPSLGREIDLNKIYWRSLSNKIIGHRGCGANSNTPKLQIGENTVLSFVTAASLGAEYVEFDVQVTKDGVPVLYHDFIVKEKGYNTPVSGLNLKQFRELHTNTTSKFKPVEDDYFGQRRRSMIDLKDDQKEDSKSQEHLYIRSPYSTLRDALIGVPEGVGFNIEIKYPSEDEIEDFEISSVTNMNTFCDAILDVVYTFGSNRNILFSSFNPDICKLVSIKQPNYPVFFLTEAGLSHSRDERTNSLQAAVKFAAENRLMGVVCESSILVEFPKLIHAVRRNGLLLFTYGSNNNQVMAVKIQLSSGVDAIIVDSVAHIRHGILAD